MGGGVGRLIPESGALGCIARVICSSEPQFLLPFRKRYCAKALGVVRCSANTKERSYSFHISDKKAGRIKKKKAGRSPALYSKAEHGGRTFISTLSGAVSRVPFSLWAIFRTHGGGREMAGIRIQRLAAFLHQ